MRVVRVVENWRRKQAQARRRRVPCRLGPPSCRSTYMRYLTTDLANIAARQRPIAALRPPSGIFCTSSCTHRRSLANHIASFFPTWHFEHAGRVTRPAGVSHRSVEDVLRFAMQSELHKHGTELEQFFNLFPMEAGKGGNKERIASR